LIPRRLDIQKINDKCKYETGYISGDITLNETKNEIKREVIFWQEKHGVAEPDVLIATPPCQGMSVANHKKSKNEINRNSLVMESIYLVDEIKPKVFMFENVAAFLKTACMDKDDQIMSIGDAIDKYLSNDYTIQSKVINFKNYGANSSRTRTLVIGVSKKHANEFSPEELFPAYTDEKTLSEVIGHLPRLKTMGEFSKDDFLHSFRSYDKRMCCWISDLKEGESAFDNTDPKKRPHQIKDGVIVPNKNKNGDKYTRQYWDKVAPCIHTRNDQLASQGTVHPEDDRVFSIREVMLMMSVPSEFKWFKEDLTELNKLTQNEKIKKLKTQEINIRQSLGEAVPTGVFFQVAQNIKNALSRKSLKHKDVMKLIKDKNLFEHYNLMRFLKENQEIYTVNTLSMIAEYSNAAREKNSAYYTDKMLLHNIYSILPEFENYKKISVLEPSVGVGSFLPLIAKKYSHVDEIIVDCIDLSEEATDILEFMVKLYDLGDNVRLNYIVNDFLKHEMDYRYDLIIGNPPFSKMTIKKKEVTNDFVNYKSKNLSSYFLEKSLKNADYVVMIMPKNLLNTTEFNETRDYISQFRINNIVDFGEYGFRGVLVETICLSIDTTKKPNKTLVSSLPMDISKIQNQSYVTSNKFPYWIIYRNDYFDNFVNNLELNVFEVFRDRQLTNANMKATTNDKVRVIKSRNITDDGKIIDIENYDAYIDRTALNFFSVSKYIDKENVYLTPNMTYKTRVMKKPKGTIVNGSVAILIPKFNKKLTKEEMNFFASNEYREYMQIARNYQTRTLNVDNNSVYFYGIRKE
ncbi:MAG: DNA cytosine methyltransferase, partial [Bacilli bacterium]|nr:DNA cytosine methyltransferase [Bacilli bacterium]